MKSSHAFHKLSLLPIRITFYQCRTHRLIHSENVAVSWWDTLDREQKLIKMNCFCNVWWLESTDCNYCALPCTLWSEDLKQQMKRRATKTEPRDEAIAPLVFVMLRHSWCLLKSHKWIDLWGQSLYQERESQTNDNKVNHWIHNKYFNKHLHFNLKI